MTAPLTFTLTDFWGEDWTLGVWTPGRRQIGIRLRSITGLAGAPHSFDEIQGANTDGVIVRGRKDEANTLAMVCLVDYPGGGYNARDYLMTWRRALGRGLARDPNSPPLRLTVEDSGRWQDIRLLTAADPDLRGITSSAGRAIDELTFRSDLSWWRADPYTASFNAAQFASATVDNDGDVDTWPSYRLTGPITNPKLGLLGELISLPTLTAGQYLDIETDPDYWSIVDQSGADRSWIGQRWETRAPANTDGITVSITGTGTSGATKLDVTVPQYYWAAI